MKRFFKWAFSRKVVITFVVFATFCDIIFTFFILKNYADWERPGSGEFNPMIRYFIEVVGLELSLFIIVPLIIGIMLLLIYRFWHFWPFRYYAYFLLVSRVALFFYNFYIVYLVFKN